MRVQDKIMGKPSDLAYTIVTRLDSSTDPVSAQLPVLSMIRQKYELWLQIVGAPFQN